VLLVMPCSLVEVMIMRARECEGEEEALELLSCLIFDNGMSCICET
jgi:hypothetical protein